jgi:two-component system response regulator FlrC
MRLLIIGDLGGELVAAGKLAVAEGAKVMHSPTIDAAVQTLLSGKQIDLIFVDIRHDIESLVGLLQRHRINVEVVACGVKNDADLVLRAIRAGAKEYLPLPPQAELIAAILASVAEHGELPEVIAKAPTMLNLLSTAKQIADSEATVMISGESGTGKEVVAQYIHACSKRRNHDLVAINCAAIPENLLESELFGHEKGAFTGATDRRVGKFEAASGSTVLLDEITEMDLRLQAKLLRVLQEKEIVRLGGNKAIQVDVRVIATSNRNVLEYVRQGGFREDLFYRLNVINLQIPALRERVLDIELLAGYFLKKYAKLNGVALRQLSAGAIVKLLDYAWPGNVRELENCMHRSLLLSRNQEIEAEDILLLANDLVSQEKSEMQAGGMSLEQVERRAIYDALIRNQGDQLKASVVLGVSLKALQNKLKQHKII